MTIKTPPLDARSTDHIVGEVEEKLLDDYGWQGRPGGAGEALVQLFGRLTELVTTRLNQVPDKHFLAFLNEAGVDLLSPRPASATLSFTAADDGPGAIDVPAGTQVATVQTETQPEVIFETQRDIVVVPNKLAKCVAFDPLNSSDRTADAKDLSTSFAVFQGQGERERVLYLGDETLFTFDDATSRKNATITISFQFATVGDPNADGWELEWLYWDGSDWSSLTGAGASVSDGTEGFSQDGSVALTDLPELTETEVDEESGLWIACKLTGGATRNYLPVLSSVKGSRAITGLSGQIAADAAFSAVQANTAFVPLDFAGEFFPLGQRPGRLDTFYLMSNEAFSKQGATVALEVEDLVGVPADATSDDLTALEIVWEYYSEKGWILLGTSKRSGLTPPTHLSFSDTTKAFTAGGEDKAISFLVPRTGESDDTPPFAKTKVNDVEGYWVRARIVDGSYNVPATVVPPMTEKTAGSYTFTEAKTHVPLIKKLKVTYTGYGATISEKDITLCRSQVDGMGQNHASDLAAEKPVAPFSAREEGPALYLGFEKAFPEEEWIQILLDVDEEAVTSGAFPSVYWEYWNGSKWAALRVSDGSQGLSERGYLGFFGLEDHKSSTEFGQSAYWLRARPHRSPVADPGVYAAVAAEGREATVTLDASGSKAFDRQTIDKYVWRSVSSTHLEAKAADVDVGVSGDGTTAVVSLDGSGSTAKEGRTIAKYIWREKDAGDEQDGEDGVSVGTSYLKAVCLNTVPALNAVTVKDEVLGASDGKPDQVFTLLKTPVLTGAQIAVREPDRPPTDELKQLEKELQQEDESAEALLSDPTTGGEGVWVRWCQVSDFHSSTSSSRHFTLDPIGGEVCFGDGERGRIPPIGRDNIKAVRYWTHGGANGNVKAGKITVLRNPSGDLANIKSVTNLEAAAGGSDAETVDEVKERGPQSLKHRQRAVTVEDFMWLALEASGEIAHARCLPTNNTLGLHEAGWVTVVVTPESEDAKPTPSASLLRYVQEYLEDRALANLKEAGQIYVKGPDYIETTVLAQVIPAEPEKSDEVELAILDLLETFLHPLKGGPERTGWGLGRDVYLSEICAEIEGVSGVDHVASVRLLGSLQQCRLRLGRKAGRYRLLPYEVPAGSQVSTFDERIKLLLAETLTVDEENPKVLKQLDVYGFKVGDKVTVVAADDTVVVSNLTIASVSGDNASGDGSSITFEQPFEKSAAWVQRDALMSADGHLRLPLKPVGEDVVEDASGKVAGVKVRGFQAGDEVSVVVGTRRHPDLEFLPVEGVAVCEDRIFVPVGHLIYSGSHDIEMVLE
ncbi:MAG: putative baseplate assembly protein [Anaerolineae bacterium]|nr:putative baseplate assembly protein [Anaerolineae bacterium]